MKAKTNVNACRVKNGGTKRKRSFEKLESRMCLASSSFEPHNVPSFEAANAGYVSAHDLDGDGDADIVGAGNGEIFWHDNTNGRGSFGSKKVIREGSNTPFFAFGEVFAIDMDGDGDLDVLSGLQELYASRLEWFENQNGKGDFSGEPRVIEEDFRFLEAARVIDIDGDGDFDVVTATSIAPYDESVIGWYENLDGKGNFGELKQIAVTAKNAIFRGYFTVHAADLDSDGDGDVLTSLRDFFGADNKFVWFENMDGKGSFSGEKTIHSGGFTNAIYTYDLDGDQDLDLLTSIYELATNTSRPVWFENTDGQGNFGTVKDIPYDSACCPIQAADVDGDTDLDIFLADPKLRWNENIDGKGTFGPQQVFSDSVEDSTSVYAADLDNDGDSDILALTRSALTWFENISRIPGDSNGDGKFDSGDLVQVFRAGEYEDGIVGNSTFEEGDWNCDGDFDSGDLVFAFQAGTYVAAAEPLHADVLAAIDAVHSQWKSQKERKVRIVPGHAEWKARPSL